MSDPGQHKDHGQTPARSRIIAGLVVLALGVVIIAAASVVESRILAQTALSEAALLVAPENPFEGGVPLRVRETDGPVSGPDPFHALLRQSPDGEQLAEQLRLGVNELLVMADSDALPWEAILVEGRLPEPGAAEVLAGVLVRESAFQLDDVSFEVVGRIAPATSGFEFVYLLPEHPRWERVFAEDVGGRDAWLFDDAELLAEQEDAVTMVEEMNDARMLGGHRLAPTHATVLTLTGLVLVAIGGAIAQVAWLLRRRKDPERGLYQPAIHGMAEHVRVLSAVHVILYGLFFLAMCIAALDPLWNMRLGFLISGEFQEGSLSHIGEAYGSGNVARAAFVTWAFNFGVATVTISVLPSLVFPGWALLKNAMTFAMVGFVMSPIWMPAAQPMTYHCITMTLELQAYVYVSFGAVLFPYYFVRGLASSNAGSLAFLGLKRFASTVAVAGTLLAIAALYEAATIIAFRL